MDRILNFVALRAVSSETPAATKLESGSAFQQQLTAAVNTADPFNAATAAAKAFVTGGRFVASADDVQNGAAWVAFYDRLARETPRDPRTIDADVRGSGHGAHPGDVTEDAARARDSVLAGYLLGTEGPSAATALKLVRAYAIADAVLAGHMTARQLDALLHGPLLLPGSLLDLHERTVPAPAPTPDEVASALTKQFTESRDRLSRVTETLDAIAQHGEDELVLSELGSRQPLSSLYQSPVTETHVGAPAARDIQAKVLDRGFAGSSPLRRAAVRTNVVLSETAQQLLSAQAHQTLRTLNLDPALSTIRDMQTVMLAERDLATQTLRGLSAELGSVVELVDKSKRHLIDEIVGRYKVEPVDDPASVEPVATAPPATFSKVKPLGVADLYLVRTHLTRYERGEVASLENILGGEKLTHTARAVGEVETTETTDREQVSLQALAQTTAEQTAGKTISQAIGAGRGPLTSDGPETFSKGVTDQVSSSSSSRTRKALVVRQLVRNENSFEHVFDNTAGTDVRFGVYQWLDKVYQAQVFSYGEPRLLYDVIVPEPASLFREALARPRGEAALPPRPAKFAVPVDKLSTYNWSYYAAGHQAAGVEAPPQAQVIVTEAFGGKAPDPFSGELNANTLEIGETRSTRIPKGYKATMYRVVAQTSGWVPYMLRAIIGSKSVPLEAKWGGQWKSGSLEGEVESLPVGLIADGNGVNPGLSTMTVGIEIVCEPTDEAMAAWQTKTHGLILAANQRRFEDYAERVANRDASARLQLQALSAERKAAIIQSELKRTTLAVLTNQNFSTFNAGRFDSFGFPYPDAAATFALSAYIRFFEQAVEWEHLGYACFPYFWGSRASWISKLLTLEPDPVFAAFLGAGAARVVLPIRPGYEPAFERFLNTGKTPTTDELLDVGGPLWVSLVSQLRSRAPADGEVAVGQPWEFRLASDLIRARRDGLLPKWSLAAGEWVESADATS